MATRNVPLQSEPLWYLKGLPYDQYRQTNHWRLRRDAYLSTFDDEIRQCQNCGLAVIDEVIVEETRYVDPSTGQECNGRKKGAVKQGRRIREQRPPAFHVHHLTYERLGEEWDEDLQLLCAPCHNLEHFPDSHAAVWWRKQIAYWNAVLESELATA